MKTSSYISEHFTWYEVEHSETAERLGIDNTVPFELERAAIATARHMERVRALFNLPIHVNSWYRGAELQRLTQFYNPNSQHPKCEAVDFIIAGMTPAIIARMIMAHTDTINFDQLILEYTWVHISWNAMAGATQKHQVLTLLNVTKPGNKKYASGLTDKFGKPL